MERIHLTPGHSYSSLRAQVSHNTFREGLSLGLIVGVATWLWVAAFDVLADAPFQTFQALSGVAGFTVIHFLLCISYGLTIMSAIHGSMKEPTIMFALIFCTILFQAAFVMLTAILVNVGVGDFAWGKFFVGNVMALVLTYVLIDRHHSLRSLLHAAEARQKD